jgi:hypothetical protein
MPDTREILMKYLYPMGRHYDNEGSGYDTQDWALDGDDLIKLIDDLDNR